MAKCKYVTYHTGSYRGGSKIYINLIRCEDNIVIPSILQIYLLHCYHKYILYPIMDITVGTGPSIDIASRRKWLIVTLDNVKNNQI